MSYVSICVFVCASVSTSMCVCAHVQKYVPVCTIMCAYDIIIISFFLSNLEQK